MELWIKTDNGDELIGRYTDKAELLMHMFELMLEGIECYSTNTEKKNAA